MNQNQNTGKNKQIKGFRLHPIDIKKLKAVSEQQGISQTSIIERALHRYFYDIEKMNA